MQEAFTHHSAAFLCRGGADGKEKDGGKEAVAHFFPPRKRPKRAVAEAAKPLSARAPAATYVAESTGKGMGLFAASNVPDSAGAETPPS